MDAENVAALLEAENRLIRLHKAYILAAFAVTLTFGTSWGVINLVRISRQQFFSGPEYAATQAHGHAQIFGWVALFIMGVAFYTFPRFKHKRLGTLLPAWTALLLLFAGVVLRSLAQPLAHHRTWADALIFSALLELIAIVLFVGNLVWVRLSSRGPGLLLEPFVLASLSFLLYAAIWNVRLCLAMAASGTTLVPEPANGQFIFVSVLGFIVNMILGYSLRFLPILLGVQKARAAPVLAAFSLFNAGVLARLLDWPVVSGPTVFAATTIFAAVIHVFEKPVTYAKTRGVDPTFPWFVRLAYFWLLIATALMAAGDLYAWHAGQLLPHSFTGAYRHALTVGFITTMMLGLGHRMLPAFVGVNLYRIGWMRVSFGLIALGNLLRVTLELATLSGRPWTFLIMGCSGFLELGAIGLFAANIVASFLEKPVYVFAPEQINPATRVRWLLEVFAPARAILEAAGVRRVDDLGPTATLEMVAADQGLSLPDLMEKLRAEVAAARGKS